MSRLTFELGAAIERKPTVLTWRLPKRLVPERPKSERENPNHSGPVFGRRTLPPV